MVQIQVYVFISLVILQCYKMLMQSGLMATKLEALKRVCILQEL